MRLTTLLAALALLTLLVASAGEMRTTAHASGLPALAPVEQELAEARGDDDDDDEDDERGACRGRSRRWCEIPEVPWTLVLPAASMSIAAGFYLVQRRRDGAEHDRADS